MSNQLWQIVSQTLTGFEDFFTQFQHCRSDISLFLLKMGTSGSQIRFDPPLANMESELFY